MNIVATILTASVFGAVSVLFIIGGIVQIKRIICLTDEDDPDYE
jgi:hypothetical protein